MGCDIHLYIEEKTADGWKIVPAPNTGGYGSEHPWRDGLDDQVDEDLREWYADRNYSVFGALAGVRGAVTPISGPRGFPSDISQEVADEAASWGPDWHSKSWLTPKELLAYNWNTADYCFGNFLRFLHEEVEPLSREKEIRLVFAFDN